LKGNEKVAARVAELQEAAARKSEITIESICRELDEANAVAKERGQASAMVSASTLRAKLAGLMVEQRKVEVDNSDFSEGVTVEMMADQMLDGLTNARWLPITDQDRQEPRRNHQSPLRRAPRRDPGIP
jgi:hypothetical protein